MDGTVHGAMYLVNLTLSGREIFILRDQARDMMNQLSTVSEEYAVIAFIYNLCVQSVGE